MKKIFMLFFAIFLSIMSFNFNQQTSFAEIVYYAKIQSENVFMYSSPNENSKLFLLPETYFVKLINEGDENFYYCNYKDIKGYVKKSQVIVMNGTPSHPYAEGMFRIFSLEGLGIYSSPKMTDENFLTTIPYLTDDLIYYGSINGQEVIPNKSNQWVYCKYNDATGISGYVYSVFCDLPKITANDETFEVITNPFNPIRKPKEMSAVSMGFIIVGVSFPCLIVLFLLIKPTILKDKLNTAKPKLRAKRNRDYFEFDDSDLN